MQSSSQLVSKHQASSQKGPIVCLRAAPACSLQKQGQAKTPGSSQAAYPQSTYVLVRSILNALQPPVCNEETRTSTPQLAGITDPIPLLEDPFATSGCLCAHTHALHVLKRAVETAPMASKSDRQWQFANLLLPVPHLGAGAAGWELGPHGGETQREAGTEWATSLS